MTNIAGDEITRFQALINSREISPELVLVDPELGEIARAALAADAETPAPVGPEPPAALERGHILVEASPLYYALDPPPFARRSVPARTRRDEVLTAASRVFSMAAPALLFGSFLVNLALAGVILGEAGGPELAPPESIPMQAAAPSPQRAVGSPATNREVVRSGRRASVAPKTKRHRRQSKSPVVARRQSKSPVVAKRTAERTVLGLVQTAPKSRIRNLLDAQTGLLKNNVQAVCRRHKAPRLARFDCVVRSSGTARGAGLYVTYTVRAGGRWSITWLGFRNAGRPSTPKQR